MSQAEAVNFLGLDCLPLKNESLELLVTKSAGPRILFLSLNGGENLLAELPDAVLDCPGSGELHLYGGHRLWHAPEEPSRTYLPDDSPVQITPIKNGCLLIQDVESKTGLQKSMQIQLVENVPQVVITHQLTNHGMWDVTCAPWAITQLKPGGAAILPQSVKTRESCPTAPLRFGHIPTWLTRISRGGNNTFY